MRPGKDKGAYVALLNAYLRTFKAKLQSYIIHLFKIKSQIKFPPLAVQAKFALRAAIGMFCVYLPAFPLPDMRPICQKAQNRANRQPRPQKSTPKGVLFD